MQSGAIGVVAACGVIIVIEQRAKMACGVGYGIASAVIGNSKVEQLLKSIPCCQIAYHPLFVAGLGAGSGGYSFECGIYGLLQSSGSYLRLGQSACSGQKVIGVSWRIVALPLSHCVGGEFVGELHGFKA